MEKRITRIIAFIEISIAIFTILGLALSEPLSLSKKSPNVFIFVLLSSIVSGVLGIGLFKDKNWAKTLLVFFSGYVILTKILIFSNLVHFNGEIITFIPTSLKNDISIAYHIFVVLFFTRKQAKLP